MNLRRMSVCSALVSTMVLGAALAAEEAATRPATEGEPTGQLIEGIVLNYLGGGVQDARVRIESTDAAAGDKPLAEGTTNELGDISIRLPEAADGPVRVRISKEGFVEFVQEIDPTDEEEPPFIEAVLEGAARLTGKVTAAGTDKPIAGAHVLCENGGRQLDTRTDDKGEFVFENVFRGSAVVTVRADGFGIEQAGVAVESDHATVNISLRPEQRVELIVVTTQGDPAPKVLVEVFTEPTQNYLNAMTDERGRAELRGISAETQALHVRLSGEQYVASTGFDETIDLEGREGPASRPSDSSSPASQPAAVRHRLVITVAASIQGRVVDARTGDPAIGVRVIAGRELLGNMPMAWTGLDGKYELTGLPPGNNVISFQHGEYATAIVEKNLATGKSETLDMKLEAGRPIAGVVVDAEGKPLPQVRVSADDWKGYATLGMRLITGDDGQFAFAHAPDGEIEFSFVQPGYGPPVVQKLTAGKTDYKIALKQETAPEGFEGFEEKLKIGEAVPDLTMTAVDGKSYKLSDLRGKFVFIDCWASWCMPCMHELPNVKALHEAMKDRTDFVLIGVSLDSDRKAFNKAVKENEIGWPQVMGPKSGAEEVFQALDGMAIPYTCLIGPDGKLLAQHLRGAEMIEEVKRLLKGKPGD